jgi:hypothetical protein
MVALKEAVMHFRVFFSVEGFFTDFLCTGCHSRNGEAALRSNNTRIEEYKNTRIQEYKNTRIQESKMVS